MLGADGPREYLVLVQNNAEQRATGGIPGSVVLLRAVDGAVKVVEQRAGNTLGGFPKPVLPLNAQEHALFGDDLGKTMLDVTFTPGFPRSGQLARAIWRLKVGGNAVQLLLNTVYLQIADPKAQDAGRPWSHWARMQYPPDHGVPERWLCR